MSINILLLAAALAPWQDPSVAEVNRMPARTCPVPCETEQMAFDVAQWEAPKETSRWVQLLKPEWKGDVSTATFKRPWRWWFRRTILQIEETRGAISVRMNGKEVGYSRDPLPLVEFDVTGFAKVFGQNTVEIEIHGGAHAEGAFRAAYVVSESKSGPGDVISETKLADDNSSAKVKISDKAGNIIKERTIEKPQLWSEELPYIYMTPIEHHYGWWIFGGIEYRAVKFGFRRFETKDGKLFINGKPARICGANRCRPKDTTKPFMSISDMIAEIRILKGMNANALLASEYPDCNDWYELCDRDGVYLVDADGKLASRSNPSILPAKAALPKFENILFTSKDAAVAYKYNHRPIRVLSVDWKNRTAKVANDYLFMDLDQLDCIQWTATTDGIEKSRGVLDPFPFPAGTTQEIKLEGLEGDQLKIEFLRYSNRISVEVFKRNGGK